MLGCCRAIPVSSQYFEYKEVSSARKIGMAGAATIIQGNVALIAPELHVDIQSLADEITKVTDCQVQTRVHIIPQLLIRTKDVITF
jgi:hypothetical protein